MGEKKDAYSNLRFQDFHDFKHELCFRVHFLQRHFKDVVNNSLPFPIGSEEEFEWQQALAKERQEAVYEDSDDEQEEAEEPPSLFT